MLRLITSLRNHFNKQKKSLKGDDLMIIVQLKRFLSDIILQFVPPHILHYPNVDIISCNIKGLLSDAMNSCNCCPQGFVFPNEIHKNSVIPSVEDQGAKESTSERNTNDEVRCEVHFQFLKCIVDSTAFAAFIDYQGILLKNN